MTDDMHQHLTALGSSPVPAPDAGFADHLELQLRDMRAVGSTAGGSVRRWPATVAAVTFSVAVIAFGLSTIQPGVDTVRISSASGAQVHMPNGSVVEAEPGLAIPEGAWVEVGPSGSASIGELVLGPGQAAEVTPEGVVLAEIIDGDPVPVTSPSSTGASDVAAPGSSNGEPVDSSGAAVNTSEPVGDTAVTDSTPPSEDTTPSEPPAAEETVDTTEPSTTTDAPATTVEDPTTTTDPATTTSASTTTAVDRTTTTRPATSLPPESSTSSSAPSTTVGTSTTVPDENGSTTTSPDESTSTTTADTTTPDTTIPGTTIPDQSTTTTEKPEGTTTTLPPDPIFGNIMGELRAQIAPCVYSEAVLIDLAYAVLAGLITPEEAQILLDC